MATLLFLDPGQGPAAPAEIAHHGAAQGVAIAEKFECNRCHVLEGVGPPPAEKRCVGCHIEIETGRFQVSPRVLRQWQRNIVHLIDVPSLTNVGQRLGRAWVQAFLRRPHRLRPALSESMPRLRYTPEEIDQLGRWLVPTEAEPASFKTADLAHGKKVLNTRGCGTCHRFTGAEPVLASPATVHGGKDGLLKGIRLAPDLRFTRERFQSGNLIRWLRAPAELKPDTLMPNAGLTANEARDVAGYIMTTPLEAAEQYRVPKRLPPLKRPVGYLEIERKILHKTCWHCHSQPDYARGDGGPGNTGGFGFPPRGIDLSDYDGLSAGQISPQGKRRSLFREVSGHEMPLLVAALWARHHEVAGQGWTDVRGMPLGLPPLSAKEIQLIETWIAQGRPE